MASPTDSTAMERKALREILGTDDPDEDLLDIDSLLDSDLAKLGEQWAAIVARYEGHVADPEWIEREAQERFFAIGFVVRVKWEVAELVGDGTPLRVPTIEIIARTEKRPDGFDHERMAYEVQNDILGTGEKGSIDVGGLLREK